MFSVWKGQRNESNAIEAQQARFRTDPQISIRGLCYRIHRAAKDSVLNPPGGVCVLGNVAGRINCPDQAHCEKKQQKEEEMAPQNLRPVRFWGRVWTALFE